MSPMPIPALNIIAIQETVRNSGASSSRPSGIRPNPLTASTNAQPPAVMTPPSTAVATALSESVPATPQTMNARTRAAAIPKTQRSSTGWWSSGVGVGSVGAASGTGSAEMWVLPCSSVMVGGPRLPGLAPLPLRLTSCAAQCAVGQEEVNRHLQTEPDRYAISAHLEGVACRLQLAE